MAKGDHTFVADAIRGMITQPSTAPIPQTLERRGIRMSLAGKGRGRHHMGQHHPAGQDTIQSGIHIGGDQMREGFIDRSGGDQWNVTTTSYTKERGVSS